ncbi:sugar-binding domain-containing protein [uncultured Sunxiuqinia sp.]|uniref:exo-beta-1,4-galactosidase n=1 Tax=uncultured Sunxiuqinia sp. TaxID=1573825 RepID=UPI002AA77471|nr:sugar-binding domain-containing protein [uncultured Sunxiuqinia sp.]
MRIYYPSCLYVLYLLLFGACNHPDPRVIDLQGKWQFHIDSQDVGIAEEWYLTEFPEEVKLPGSMKENGKGEIPTLETKWTGSIYDSSFFFNPALEKYRQKGDIKFPFWLTPNLYYKGAAWYRKQVVVPQSWEDSPILLSLERPHWQTDVWFDDQYVGSQNSLSVAHVFELPANIRPGVHFISVRVDNRLDKISVGPDSHSVSDHTQGNWNGIVGQMSLRALPEISIADVQVFPDRQNKIVRVKTKIKNSTGTTQKGKLQFTVYPKDLDSTQDKKSLEIDFSVSNDYQVVEAEYSLGEDVLLWDEFNPNLYELKVTLNAKESAIDFQNVIFGVRDFTVSNGGFSINDRPVFLRGTVECNTFPLTGYPPTDVQSWERIFKICKESGLNHMRFHSHCPPEAAFIAADKIGFYLQPEAATWPNHSSSLGDGRPVDQYVLDETERIFKAYGNHPSFVMWAYGNEPRGNYVQFLDQSLKEWKQKDKRRVYTGASIGMSWSIIPESEYLVRSGPRGLPFKKRPNSIFDYYEKIKDETRPYVTHEMGQWCVFPNFKEIAKYTGVYKAKNFELFQEELSRNHMANQAEDFLMASGKLQALCYKAEIEACFRTPGLDGFQLLGLNDFPGQGTALVGMLDVFWDEKGYITKEKISHFCNQTVPLSIMDKFVFSNNEAFNVKVKVAHFGAQPLVDASSGYSIFNQHGDTLDTGFFNQPNIPIGNETVLGEIGYDLSKVKTATKCKLEVFVNNYTNSWDFWVYPEKLPQIKHDSIYYTNKLDDQARMILENGGKVFLDASGEIENGKDVKAYFTPVFWNTSWFKMRPPHTLGILVENDHPAFADFPTDFHSDYQWWEILNGQQVINIDAFPVDFKPLVQPIDTWFLNRRLAQLFEARVGNGKLMVSSLNHENMKEAGSASAQLLYSISKYMNSDQFKPVSKLDYEVVHELFEKKERETVNLYTRSGPDELKPDKVKK